MGGDNISATISEIIRIHEWMMAVWDEGLPGWAPASTTVLLERNRLDRLHELALVLPSWTKPEFQSPGHLLLAWAALGALAEGVLRWFLCVYEGDYSRHARKDRNGTTIDPDRLRLEDLRQFYDTVGVWMPEEAAERRRFVEHVQQRRNAIHAYQDREIGDFEEFWASVRDYLAMLDDLHGRASALEP